MALAEAPVINPTVEDAHWRHVKGCSRLSWSEARLAVRAAWNRVAEGSEAAL